MLWMLWMSSWSGFLAGLNFEGLNSELIGYYLTLLTIQTLFWLAFLGLDKLKQRAKLRYKGGGGEGGGSGMSTHLQEILATSDVVSSSEEGAPATAK